MMFRAPSQLSRTMEVNRTLEYLASWAMESIRSRASGHRVHFVVQKSITWFFPLNSSCILLCSAVLRQVRGKSGSCVNTVIINLS